MLIKQLLMLVQMQKQYCQTSGIAGPEPVTTGIHRLFHVDFNLDTTVPENFRDGHRSGFFPAFSVAGI